MWSISYVTVAPLCLLVLCLIGFFRALNVSSHFLICVLRDYPHLCVSYGALSATMYVCVLWSSLRHYVCVLCLTGMCPRSSLFVSHGAFPSTLFVSYGALSGTISDCGVTSGALSGTMVWLLELSPAQILVLKDYKT